MRLFVDPEDEELLACLTNEESAEMETIVAAIEPHTGEYQEIISLSNVFGPGRVMQRMSMLYNGRFLIGWLVSSSVSHILYTGMQMVKVQDQSFLH